MGWRRSSLHHPSFLSAPYHVLRYLILQSCNSKLEIKYREFIVKEEISQILRRLRYTMYASRGSYAVYIVAALLAVILALKNGNWDRSLKSRIIFLGNSTSFNLLKLAKNQRFQSGVTFARLVLFLENIKNFVLRQNIQGTSQFSINRSPIRLYYPLLVIGYK